MIKILLLDCWVYDTTFAMLYYPNRQLRMPPYAKPTLTCSTSPGDAGKVVRCSIWLLIIYYSLS